MANGLAILYIIIYVHHLCIIQILKKKKKSNNTLVLYSAPYPHLSHHHGITFKVIQWCFQLLGNRFPCAKLQQEPPAAAIKLVNPEGLVKIYDTPINAAEIMKEFPKHLVCRSDSLYIGQKIPALSEDDRLQLGNNYFLLPKHYFQSALSFVTVASFYANSHLSQPPHLPTKQQLPFSSPPSSSDSINAKRALVKKMSTCQPFHIQKTQSGGLRIRVSDEFVISQLMEKSRLIKGKGTETEEDDDDDDHGNKTGRVCTTPQLHKDYAQLVGSSRLTWKPKLDTIRETTEKRKLNFSSSFGMMNTRNIVVKRSSSSSSNGVSSSSSSSSQYSSKELISRPNSGKHKTSPKSSSSQHHLQSAASPKPSKSKSKSKTKKTQTINIKIKIDIKSRK